jgi:hypothetical protein
MLVLITILAATYITLAAIITFGYGLLTSRTSNNVKAVLRAEEWRLARAEKLAASTTSRSSSAGALSGAGRD